MRKRVLMGAAVATLFAVGFTVWSRDGSDPKTFKRDFRAVVAAQAKRTEGLQASAKRALGGDVSALSSVFESMLVAAEASLGDYAHLRAPERYEGQLKHVVTQARGEVDALEVVLDVASKRADSRLTIALRELGDALAAREGAIQRVLQAIEGKG